MSYLLKLLNSNYLLILLFGLALNAQASDKKDPVDLQNQVNEVQSQVDDLVEQGGKYVYAQLAQKNRVSPFAVGRQSNGGVVMLEVPKSEEGASLQDKVLKLRQMLKLAADSERFVAGALFVQAKVPHKGKEVDGVAIEMEHQLGISVLRFTPYEVDRKNKKIKFKKPVDKVKPNVFFTASIAKDVSAAE